MPKKRDTCNYNLWDSHEKVYEGITDDPRRREGEHRQEGKRFDQMKISGPRVSRETALEREQEAIEKYRRGHGGRPPKYNE